MNQITYYEDGPPRMVVEVDGVEQSRECYVSCTPYGNKLVPRTKENERLVETISGTFIIFTTHK